MSPLRRIFAKEVLLPDGWARDVEILVDADGLISSLRPGMGGPGFTVMHGPVVPGMPNGHSHAFQRALVGRTQALRGTDDFWSWRTLMYGVAGVIDPDDLEAVAAWTFSEMVASGYTSVAEFHYLHRDPEGRPYDDPAELSFRSLRAAGRAGIGITLLPVLYRRAGFDGFPLEGPARRFGLGLDEFTALVERLRSAPLDGRHGLGIAPHSLRAVAPDDLSELLGWWHSTGGGPVHMHVSEQQAEIREAIAATGRAPVAWLLEHMDPGPEWTLIHATHSTPEERDGLAARLIGVGLCPATEADLGDGIFPLSSWMDVGGQFSIGSDSNAHVSPMIELRLLVYTARLGALRRGALPLDDDRPMSAQLWQRAARQGGAALGLPVGEIRTGFRADLVELDPRAPLLSGLTADQALDAVIMSGNPGHLARVVVAGEVCAEHGRHAAATGLEDAARNVLLRIAGKLGRTS